MTLTLDQAWFVKVLRNCLVCDSDELEPILNLRQHYLTDFVDAPVLDHPKSELSLCRCGNCNFMQLTHAVNRSKLFRQYWYKSGVNTTMVNHLAALAKDARERLGIVNGDTVLDIGANDGTFLREFPARVVRLGFEPATNLVDEAAAGDNAIANEFFNIHNYRAHFRKVKPKLITSLAMFYDLENPRAFVSDIREVMHKKGLWCVEMNYAGSMLSRGAFDIIGHEHLGMYFLSSFNKLVRSEGLEVVDVSFNELNGGSFRLWVANKGAYGTSERHDIFLNAEVPLREPIVTAKFGKKAEETADILRNWLSQAKVEGKTVYAYGASTRGMTTLQYIGADSTKILKAVDRNPVKVGKLMAGLDIPIVDEATARREKPDYQLVLPWGFKTEFLEREKAYLAGGGRFIFPLPEPEIIGG